MDRGTVLIFKSYCVRNAFCQALITKHIYFSNDFCHVCAQLCLFLCNPMDCSPPGSSVYEFSRQEYWSESPFPTSGDFSHPEMGVESPALAGRFFTTAPPTCHPCNGSGETVNLERNHRSRCH